jgi:hypothetical protein
LDNESNFSPERDVLGAFGRTGGHTSTGGTSAARQLTVNVRFVGRSVMAIRI